MGKTFCKVRFPPVCQASEGGLLMVGGQLTTEWLLTAYRRGIFPWPIYDGQTDILAWFSPDPRAILELDRLHVSHRLQRRLRSNRFRVTLDADFRSVIAACAEARGPEEGTWITPHLAEAYVELHRLGVAHSVEVWREDRLVGGVYGLALGGFFAGESMFHRERDASKVALVHLVRHLQSQGFVLFDVQQASPHLVRMGATEVPRNEFLARLKHALDLPASFTDSTRATGLARQPQIADIEGG
ncbi:MAG: leucyl/phenylalanyl-tRNA--protein transferase [Candidatus Anammoximicrobium sp.]|nr:leucyl/phenylalanyl-tRNA--protein transferase [Candidatus Anammoximicrobium sp.]